MPDAQTIQKYIEEKESPALQLEGLDKAIMGAGDLGPNGEYVLVYSVQRILILFQMDGATFEQAVKAFETQIKNVDHGPGSPMFIDELTREKPKKEKEDE